MSRKTSAGSGHSWARRTAQHPVGLTLSAEERQALRQVTADCGLTSAAELCRRLVRWAVAIAETEKGLATIKDISANFSGSKDVRTPDPLGAVAGTVLLPVVRRNIYD